MTELLAPAGNMEALKAAISNGCDAIYLGMQKFGARAYSNNFDLESLAEAVEFAHLRNVKIFVTMNTIVFENEIEDMKKAILDGADFAEIESISKHREWFERFKRNYTFTEENVDGILKAEIGKTFVRVLEDAGVYKNTEAGDRAFLRFIDAVNA